MKIAGKASTKSTTLSRMRNMRPQPEFCDLEALTLGRVFGPNSEGDPICCLTD